MTAKEMRAHARTRVPCDACWSIWIRRRHTAWACSKRASVIILGNENHEVKWY